MGCLIALAIALLVIVGLVILNELVRYRWFYGCYPWQEHEPRDWRSPIAVLDENGNTKYIMDDE